MHRATYCAIARIITVRNGGFYVHRATYCAIARIITVRNGGILCAPGDLLRHRADYHGAEWRDFMYTGRPTAPLRGVLPP
jgi:hypothetical protein